VVSDQELKIGLEMLEFTARMGTIPQSGKFSALRIGTLVLKEGSMRSAFVIVFIVSAAAVIATPAFAQTQAAVEKGMKLFADQKCSLCHSVAGKGNAKGPLEDAVQKLSAADIREWLVHPEEMREKAHAERKPFMKSYSTLSKDDLDALVAYTQSLKKK
jgi:mono/diheme cytochrome c family protein